MKVRIKKLVPEACIPAYMKPDDSGMDLVATSKIFDSEGNVVYGTGISMEIPNGYMGLIFPRSSNAKKDLILSNSVGIIDPGYRGEIFLKFKPTGYFASVPEDELIGFESDHFDYICFSKECPEGEDVTELYAIGDRIGQIVIIPRPTIEWEEVEELTETVRGEGGYGSSGL
jgi:dUTP pyrophosphatase